jgi:hypothetical protein
VRKENLNDVEDGEGSRLELVLIIVMRLILEPCVAATDEAVSPGHVIAHVSDEAVCEAGSRDDWQPTSVSAGQPQCSPRGCAGGASDKRDAAQGPSRSGKTISNLR